MEERLSSVEVKKLIRISKYNLKYKSRRHSMLIQKVKSLLALTGVSLALIATPTHAQTAVNYTLAGASPGGLWTLLGSGLDRVAKKGNSSSSITYQTTGGGFANASLVDRGRAQLGLIHDAELAIAVQGGAPFKQPMEDLRVIGYLYDWAPMQFIANKSFADKHNISSLADFAENKAPAKITVNRAGNITGQIATAMLSDLGVTQDNVKDWGGALITAGSSEQSTLFQNNRVDVFTNGVFVGHSSIRELENAVDIKLLSVPEETRKSMSEKFGIRSFTIPAGSYKNQDQDIETVALGAVLVVNKNLPEQEAYELTKNIIENIDDIRTIHPAMGALTTELLVTEAAAPFHEGAIRAYKEKELMQ